jgi:hypothetical protein
MLRHVVEPEAFVAAVVLSDLGIGVGVGGDDAPAIPGLR